MIFEYEPHGRYAIPVDEARCRASVIEPGRAVYSHQCQRKATHGKWCKQHHPDTVAARRKKQGQDWEKKIRGEKLHRILSGLQSATVAQLKAELARRKA